MPINPDAVGAASEPAGRSWSSKDSLLYALGVGPAPRTRRAELEFTTENSQDVSPAGPAHDGRRAAGGRDGLQGHRRLQPDQDAPRRPGHHAPREIPPRAACGPSPRSWHLRQGLRRRGARPRPAAWSTTASRCSPTDGRCSCAARVASAATGARPLPLRGARPGPRPRGHLPDPHRPGAALPAHRRPQPAALRPQVRRHGRLPPAHPPRAVHLRLHRPGAAALLCDGDPARSGP